MAPAPVCTSHHTIRTFEAQSLHFSLQRSRTLFCAHNICSYEASNSLIFLFVETSIGSWNKAAVCSSDLNHFVPFSSRGPVDSTRQLGSCRLLTLRLGGIAILERLVGFIWSYRSYASCTFRECLQGRWVWSQWARCLRVEAVMNDLFTSVLSFGFDHQPLTATCCTGDIEPYRAIRGQPMGQITKTRCFPGVPKSWVARQGRRPSANRRDMTRSWILQRCLKHHSQGRYVVILLVCFCCSNLIAWG